VQKSRLKGDESYNAKGGTYDEWTKRIASG
jgi:hypothetical protein